MLSFSDYSISELPVPLRTSLVRREFRNLQEDEFIR